LNMIVSSIGFAVGITIVKSAVEYHNNKTKKKEREYFSFIKLFIIGSLVVFIGVSFLYNLISELLFNGKVYFALAFLTLTILALYYTVSSYFLIGVKDFKSLSKYNLLIGTVFILSLLMVMYTDLSYNSLYTITLLLASFYFTGILLCVRKYAQLIPGFNRIEFKLHSTDENYFKKITLPAFLSNLVYAFTVWLQIIIVGYLLNDRNMASEVATGLIWFNALAFIPQTISTVILPRISSENKNKLKILKVGMLINVCSTCI
ncbi:O64 family O-antigen flippase, partial [Escherichia coli]